MSNSNWTSADVAKQQGKPVPAAKKKAGKGRGAVKATVIDGIKFHSTMEGECYKLLKNSKLEFETQPRYILQPKFSAHGKNYQAITYTADFLIKADEYEYIIDVKGHIEESFKRTRKLMLYRGYELTTVKGTMPFMAVISMIKSGENPVDVYKAIDCLHNA